jgi:hypothetical protein
MQVHTLILHRTKMLQKNEYIHSEYETRKAQQSGIKQSYTKLPFVPPSRSLITLLPILSGYFPKNNLIFLIIQGTDSMIILPDHGISSVSLKNPFLYQKPKYFFALV